MTSNIIPRREHFRLEFSGVQLPFGCLDESESDFHALLFERIIGRHGATDALAQHGRLSFVNA